MALEVTIHPLARADLFDLYAYIEDHSGYQRAGDFVDRIEAICMSLATFPERGAPRADLGEEIRTIAFERRVLIVYRSTAARVEILRVLYAGRDFSGDDVPA